MWKWLIFLDFEMNLLKLKLQHEQSREFHYDSIMTLQVVFDILIFNLHVTFMKVDTFMDGANIHPSFIKPIYITYSLFIGVGLLWLSLSLLILQLQPLTLRKKGSFSVPQVEPLKVL